MSRNPAALTAMLSIAWLLAACTPKEQAPLAPAQPPPPAEGAPRIANSADGVHIEYHVYGSGDPAIVLVHGWSCDSNYWRAQLDALKAKYTVVTLDLGGHGASGRNRSAWSIGNYGEDVAAVVRAIPNPHVVLVGHSMGGPVVLEASQRIGDRVIGIVGVDTFKGIGRPPLPQEQIEQMVEPFRKDFIGHTRTWVTEYFFPKSADQQLVGKIAYDMSLAPPEVAVPSIVSLYEMDFTTVLQGVHVPIIAINTERGERTDEARIRKAAPTFRAVIIPGTGHFPMMEDPQRFNSMLLHELSTLTVPAATPTAGSSNG